MRRSQITVGPYYSTQDSDDIDFNFNIKKIKILFVATFGVCLLVSGSASAVDMAKYAHLADELESLTIGLKKKCAVECELKLLAMKLLNDELIIEKTYDLQLRNAELELHNCKPKLLHVVSYTFSGFFIGKSKEHLAKSNKTFSGVYLIFAVMTSLVSRFF